MRPNDVQVGHFYLRKGGGFVREIQYETPDGDVGWRDYDYHDGKPFSSGLCSKYHLSQWAERELTPSEVLKMQTGKADEVQEVRNAALTRAVLQALSDEELLAELRRRGIDISQSE